MPIWSSCMAEDGHNYATPDEAQSAAADLTQPLWEWAPTADPSAGSLADQPEVIEVRDAEVAIAVADARCRESSGLTAARAAVTTDLETTFARENKETMDTLLNRYPIGAAQ